MENVGGLLNPRRIDELVSGPLSVDQLLATPSGWVLK